MKKPMKIVLCVLGGILALALLAIVTLPLWVGPAAAGAARGVVPALTGCDFKLERISLNPFSGKFRLVEAHLANPKGYDTPDAFSVGEVRVDVEVASLLTDTIHFRDISIDRPFVSYVFDEAGSNNFDRIMAAVQQKVGTSEKKETKKEEKKGGKKVMIDRLSIDGTKVKYRFLTLPIPVPTLTNIGKDSGGATPEEVRETVWSKIKDSFSSVGSGIGSAADALGKGATNALKGAADLLKADAVKDGAKATTKALDDGAKATAKALDDSAKAATKALDDGAKAVGDGAKDALKKVGNLFGK